MKKIRLLTLLALGLFAGTTAFAQSRVSGVVTESGTGKPLQGVVVQIKGTTTGDLTKADGSYTINSAQVANGTLIFSFAGMKKIEVPVAGKSAISVTLQPDALLAQGVTVTALGGKKQERKLGYATTTVDGDDLARTNTISPVNALQGKVAGLQISTSGSGGLTGSPTITLRGAKSITKNNSPIFVIDGIVMENAESSSTNATAGNTGANSGLLYGNQLKNLNAEDYESVTVLKGAAATSLYGSRGANGAIVITTKSGKSRKGVGVEVSYSHEFAQTYAPPVELQNVYGMGAPSNSYEGGIISGTTSTAANYSESSFGPKMNMGTQMQQHYKMTNTDTDPVEDLVSYEDNWKALFQTGQQNRVNVALTGGSDKATIRLSYGYADMKGTLPNNSFKRHSINVRTNGQINDIFSADFSLQYSNSTTVNANQVNYDNPGSYGLISASFMNRSTDLAWYRDNYIDKTTWARIPIGTDNSSGALRNLQNALNVLVDPTVTHQEQTIIGSVGLTGQFTDWLDARVSLSYNSYQYFNEEKLYGAGYGRGNGGPGGTSYEAGGGRYSTAGGTSGSYDFLGQIHSNNRFVDDNLELDVRMFYEIYGNTQGSAWSKVTNSGLAVPGIWSFSNSNKPLTQDQYNGGNGNPMRYRNSMVTGVGGAVNLSWKDQVNLELTARNDWLSSLLYPTWMPTGQNNYSVFYPSANVSWVFSDTFQIDPKIISYGKLRASIAQVGSGTSAYETSDGAGAITVTTVQSSTGANVFAGSPSINTLPNYDLKPEIQQQLEFGADVRFLDGKIGLDVAYYKINTKNQILKLAAIRESGVTERLINAGNIQNQGWELQLDFRPIQTRSIRWEFGFNWSRNRSKVIALTDNLQQYTLFNGQTGAVAGIYCFVGGPFGQIVSGSGYGYTSGGAGMRATYRNTSGDAANDYKNGKAIIGVGGKVTSPTIDPTWSAAKQRAVENSARAYTFYNGTSLTNYYHGVLPVVGGVQTQGYNTPGDVAYQYDVMGNVQPDFFAGFNTTLSYNIPNAGSLDLYAQIDGRMGGQMISTRIREAHQFGNIALTMYGRDEEHGGLARTNYKGDIESNGYIIDGVFRDDSGRGTSTTITSLLTGASVDLAGMTMKEAVAAGHIEPMLSELYYTNGQYAWGGSQNINISDATYFSLREVTIGYNFPERWIKHAGMQSARLSLSGRNLCYLYNGLVGGVNPESMSSNNPLAPVDYGGVPYVRTFSVNLNVRF